MFVYKQAKKKKKLKKLSDHFVKEENWYSCVGGLHKHLSKSSKECEVINKKQKLGQLISWWFQNEFV